jgi:hypothetical protein
VYNLVCGAIGFAVNGFAVNDVEVPKEIVIERRVLEGFLYGDYEKEGHRYNKVRHTCCAVLMDLFFCNLALIEVIKGGTTSSDLIWFRSTMTLLN